MYSSDSEFDDNEYNITRLDFFDRMVDSHEVTLYSEGKMFSANKCIIEGYCSYIDELMEIRRMITFPRSVKAHQVHRFLQDCYGRSDDEFKIGQYEFISDIISYAGFLSFIEARDILWKGYDKCLMQALKDEEWPTTRCIPASWTVMLLDPYRKHMPRSMRFIESFTAVTMLQNPIFREKMFMDNKMATMKLSSETLVRIMEIYLTAEDQARQKSKDNALERASFEFVTEKYKDAGEMVWNIARKSKRQRILPELMSL